MKKSLVAAVLLAGILLSYSVFAAVSYSVDSLSVYQSDTNATSEGLLVCTLADMSNPDACDTNLAVSTSYRFELTVSNSGSTHGRPDFFKFLSAYSASDVLGSDRLTKTTAWKSFSSC